MSTGEFKPDVFNRASCTSAAAAAVGSGAKGVGVGSRLLFSFIVIGREIGLVVAMGAMLDDSMVGVPF
jgi:hypothetical protein